MTDKPDWWPAGADEQLAKDCNCEYCSELVAALEQHRNGIAIDGENQPLDSFA